MKGGSLALVGLAIGAVGVLMAVLIKARWARPVGAILLAVAVLAEVAAVQAGPSHSANGGGGGGQRATLPPSFGAGSSVPVTPSGGLVTLPPARPHLLSQVHPGLLPITKAIILNKEFIRLFNSGTNDAHIGGWVLSNGSFSYTFPVGTVVLHGQSLVVRTGTGTNVPGTIHLNQTHYIWPHDGGHAILKDGSGKVLQTCTYAAVSTDNPSASC
jgi:Lamin Tail Domain